MKGGNYRDPLRRIIKRLEVGSGCDRLLLSCNHEVAKDHRAKWGARTSCHQCREWFE